MSAARPLLAVLVLVVLIATAGLLFEASPSDAQSAAAQDAQVQQRMSVCPVVGSAKDGADVVATFVAEDAAGGSGAIRGSGSQPRALPDPGTATTVSADPSGSSIVVIAQDAATGSTATVREYLDPADEGRGLAVASCTRPAAQWWFVGVSGEIGHIDRLLLANPTLSPAVVAIDVYGPDGPISVAGGSGIVLQPGASGTVRVDSLIPGVAPAALRVRTTAGLVSAALLSTVIDGLIPRGAEFVPAAAEPAERVIVPGMLSGAGSRELLLTASDEDAAVRIDYLSGDGPMAGQNEQVPVPAGHTVSVDITADTAETVAAVAVSATAPVAAAVRSTVQGELPPDATGVLNRVPVADTAWTAGQPAIPRSWSLPFAGAPGTQACALLSSDGAGSTANLTMWAATGSPTQQQVEIPASSAICVPVDVTPSAATLVMVGKAAGDGELRAAAIQWGASENGPLAAAAIGTDVDTTVSVPASHPDPLALGGG